MLKILIYCVPLWIRKRYLFPETILLKLPCMQNHWDWTAQTSLVAQASENWTSRGWANVGRGLYTVHLEVVNRFLEVTVHLRWTLGPPFNFLCFLPLPPWLLLLFQGNLCRRLTKSHGRCSAFYLDYLTWSSPCFLGGNWSKEITHFARDRGAVMQQWGFEPGRADCSTWTLKHTIFLPVRQECNNYTLWNDEREREPPAPVPQPRRRWLSRTAGKEGVVPRNSALRELLFSASAHMRCVQSCPAQQDCFRDSPGKVRVWVFTLPEEHSVLWVATWPGAPEEEQIGKEIS